MLSAYRAVPVHSLAPLSVVPPRLRPRPLPDPAGSDAGQALRNTLDLARHAERLGYHRYWLAEHHNMPGIASAATSVVIGHVAGGTSTIRVGSGGVMLPNHSPLVIAEQFGTLASLYPGRIDLGLGRAPGTDPRTTYALRRERMESADTFPRDVLGAAGLLPAGRPGPGGPGRPGRRARRPYLAPRLEPLQRPAGGRPRPALRLRGPFRPGPPRRGPGNLPRGVQASPGGRSPTPWSGSASMPRPPTPRRRGSSPRPSSRS